MRFLLVNNHCISDPTAGLTHSMRTLIGWLADAGHDCHVLTTARFESRVTFTIEEHLRQQGVELPPRQHDRASRKADRAIVHYTVRHVPTALVLTRHHDEARPDRLEAAQYLREFDRLVCEREIEPWYDAVCALWDDVALYEAVAARGRDIAGARYSEAVSRRRHVEYFTSLTPRADPLVSIL